MKFKSKRVLVAIVIAVILIFGVPILINECYKHGGYVTVWDAPDVLSYYGTVLAAGVTIATPVSYTHLDVYKRQLFVLAVGFRNIPIQAFAAAGAFQNTGQDMRVGRVIDFLTPISIDFPFLLRKVPIFF